MYPKNRNVAVEPFNARLKCVCGKNKIGIFNKLETDLNLSNLPFRIEKRNIPVSIDSWLHIS